MSAPLDPLALDALFDCAIAVLGFVITTCALLVARAILQDGREG